MNSEVVEYKINKLLQEINTESMIPVTFEQFYLKPIKDLYLNNTATKFIYGEQGNKPLISTFLAVGGFILFLAIINYVNLSTARSTLRSKEIIIKKVMGSSKILLGKQFIGESTILVLLSFLIALTTMQLIVTKFNQLAHAQINLSDFNILSYWALLFVGILGLGITSGIYPAMILTRLRSVASIYSKAKDGSMGVRLRRVLLTIQFSVSIVLIIVIITNFQQINFVKNADPGFNKDQVLLVHTPGGGDSLQYLNTYRETFKELLLQNSRIIQKNQDQSF
jgi:putative ABC transport system permease protein